MRPHGPIAALLVVATFAVYLQVRHHDFVSYDDTIYLSRISSGLSLEGVRTSFTSQIVSNWVPVTWIALRVDYELYGREPAGYHLTSVALHALNAVLLFFAFTRMTGAVWRSAFVAAVFALHPLHVESVAWLSERKDVLSGLFFMLTLHAYLGWVRRRTPARYALVAAALALGLMSKPMLVTLPFVLLLLDSWPLARLGSDGTSRPDPCALRGALVEKLPLFALVAAASVVAFATQRIGGSLADIDVIPLAARLENALDSYVVYVLDSLWPIGLAVFYPHPQGALPLWRGALAGGLLLGATVLALRAGRRHPWAPVGWLWYLGMLVPVIGLVQVGGQARADRYMYLPQIGLSIVVAWGAAEWLTRRRGARLALAATTTVALAALGIAAAAQVSHWRNTVALNERALSVTNDNFRAHHSLAAALRRRGRLAEAERHYAEAVRLQPGRARSLIGLAEVRLEQDELGEAIAAYQSALKLAPGHMRARVNLGNALLRAGRYGESQAQFERALELGAARQFSTSGQLPFLVSLHFGLATALERQDDGEGAARHYEAVLGLRPRHEAARAALRRTASSPTTARPAPESASPARNPGGE